MPRFDQRSHDREIMDNLLCDGDVVYQTLRELEIINRWLGGNQVTLDGLGQLLADVAITRPLTVVDLGCGGGDMLIRIADWGRSQQRRLRLKGLDANPNIVSYAARQVMAYDAIEMETQNIFSAEFLESDADAFVATLFIHHFTDEQLVALLQWMHKRARIGFVINDIHRHWLAYYSIRILTRLFSRSRMVQFDAPLSVLRAFNRKELQSLLFQAGITRYSLKWHWAFRWQLVVKANPAG
jgi:SAM-dependent methyltransferase